MTRKMLGILVVLLLYCSGPLVAATAFTCPDPGTVKLETTTLDEIKEAYPYGFRTSSLSRNGQSMEIVTYTQTSVRKSLAVAKKVIPARALSFYFLDGILVGYEFVSSFKEDHTDFDDAKTSEIKQGETTLEDVDELLGKACGRYVYPLVAGDAESARVYSYSQVRGTFSLKIYTKTLVVTFDSSGVVTEVSLAASGER